ncbi:MAG: hypothetical protein DMG17_06795 [Acidobacteria bacterium]|nr:MAG: hypothetical protein DMG17_06795 [Acidobacteriota bacterium]
MVLINEHTIRNEIAAGEGSRSEFKSSLRWYINGAKNDERIIEVLEAIAGFLNTVDGVLLIGARDDGSLHGIASDGKIYHQRCQEESRAADSNLRAVSSGVLSE